MIVALLRHAATEWNALGRMQGRTDVPLSEAGRAQARSWRIPASLQPARIVSSPLVRAVETARILGGGPPRSVPELIEMDWGVWEGRTLASLRAELGEAFERNAARGLDFRPPGGESPREVLQRLRGWLARVPRGPAGPLVAVTHKGVIRAALVAATGWDMTGKPPQKLHDGTMHLFRLAADGTPAPERLNIPLTGGQAK